MLELRHKQSNERKFIFLIHLLVATLSPSFGTTQYLALPSTGATVSTGNPDKGAENRRVLERRIGSITEHRLQGT
jgi:hypothetical protein